MKKSRIAEEQIAYTLKQVERGKEKARYAGLLHLLQRIDPDLIKPQQD